MRTFFVSERLPEQNNLIPLFMRDADFANYVVIFDLFVKFIHTAEKKNLTLISRFGTLTDNMI